MRDDLTHRLHVLTPEPIDIIWHENKRSYLSFKKFGKKRFVLRLHRLFYDAPTPVLEAVIAYVFKNSLTARAVVRQMAHLHFSKGLGQPKHLLAAGEVYHLQGIFDALQELLPTTGVTIGWSDRARMGQFRSITFGTFDQHRRQIRIHPILDQKQVPLYFLEFVVYHEMLHSICPSKMGRDGRCSIHTKEFRELEIKFPHYKQAKLWEKGCLTFFKKGKFYGRS